jgi:hypothetical protein
MHKRRKKGQKDKQFATTHAVNVKLIIFNKDWKSHTRLTNCDLFLLLLMI